MARAMGYERQTTSWLRKIFKTKVTIHLDYFLCRYNIILYLYKLLVYFINRIGIRSMSNSTNPSTNFRLSATIVFSPAKKRHSKKHFRSYTGYAQQQNIFQLLLLGRWCISIGSDINPTHKIDQRFMFKSKMIWTHIKVF